MKTEFHTISSSPLSLVVVKVVIVVVVNLVIAIVTHPSHLVSSIRNGRDVCRNTVITAIEGQNGSPKCDKKYFHDGKEDLS